MKIVLNTYKICDTEHDRYIIINDGMIEAMYNLYQTKIKELNDFINSENREPSLHEVRKLKNYDSTCNQILNNLDSRKIPYTCMTKDNVSTLTIHGGIERTRKA